MEFNALVLCRLNSWTMYSALDARVLGVPPSGGDVCAPDTVPPEGGTSNLFDGGAMVISNSVPASSRLSSFSSIATSLMVWYRSSSNSSANCQFASFPSTPVDSAEIPCVSCLVLLNGAASQPCKLTVCTTSSTPRSSSLPP